MVEILSPLNENDTRNNVWSYTTIPSVWEILHVLHAADVRAELLRREEDGAWPDNSLMLTLGDTVTLESIDFAGRSPHSIAPHKAGMRRMPAPCRPGSD